MIPHAKIVCSVPCTVEGPGVSTWRVAGQGIEGKHPRANQAQATDALEQGKPEHTCAMGSSNRYQPTAESSIRTPKTIKLICCTQPPGPRLRELMGWSQAS